MQTQYERTHRILLRYDHIKARGSNYHASIIEEMESLGLVVTNYERLDQIGCSLVEVVSIPAKKARSFPAYLSLIPHCWVFDKKMKIV